MKKKWKKPELVVLGRSRPEESVLAFCKTGGDLSSIDSADGTRHVGCMSSEGECPPPDGNCLKCCGASAT